LKFIKTSKSVHNQTTHYNTLHITIYTVADGTNIHIQYIIFHHIPKHNSDVAIVPDKPRHIARRFARIFISIFSYVYAKHLSK